MAERHKHADLIIAWANGAEIEVQINKDTWCGYSGNAQPSWVLDFNYRIKPKPPIVRYGVANKDWPTAWWEGCSGVFNVKATFDPETGDLLTIEKIK